ncbi:MULTISPECIES: TetR/AcrR family transcriptional regulator [Gordonia]|uniref:Putative TetR family transcriptional regulator n=1 Tax=Gordonia sputi NBRC 100414 TaxID=1089453 RepID=H5TWX5_9ACTN|nr:MULTISPECIES: TetR/AcrR family transcriptional regulator [Gordonia]MCM3894453.1 TetR/AcrR family transcriptional regulator [Gordonia sputi]NKY94849.1 TetR/AcrR family transcriptional regulator [Gordonia sputi]OBA32423.1 TetR family transcriptional regulator [Gordonia sp. 852002-51296_SCH5728562-b]OBA74450.1 TetR family transcriptional regulator [Gordonia sp. 852002-10350_SCH5691597]GAB37983.1 putative TetR family transcriptional regulator [Gordonia sputi NBRC 100414]
MSDRRTSILEAAVRVIAEHGVRGLRVAQLSAEAGVSTALIYYHFTDRDGILRAALEYINERAQDYTTPSADSHPRTQLESMLLDELQDTDEVRTASVAWGELRASAAFTPALQEPLRASTAAWDRDVEDLITRIPDAITTDPAATAARLTALVEGLSERWHSGSIELARARDLLRGAIEHEVGPRQPA